MLRLEKVNGKNVWDILKLRVAKEQENFVAHNDISIIEAYCKRAQFSQKTRFLCQRCDGCKKMHK